MVLRLKRLSTQNRPQRGAKPRRPALSRPERPESERDPGRVLPHGGFGEPAFRRGKVEGGEHWRGFKAAHAGGTEAAHFDEPCDSLRRARDDPAALAFEEHGVIGDERSAPPRTFLDQSQGERGFSAC